MVEGPKILIAFENDMTTKSSIASIRTPFGDVFFAVQMHRALASITGANIHLDIVYKIPLSH
jgi:hypothetical protein